MAELVILAAVTTTGRGTDQIATASANLDLSGMDGDCFLTLEKKVGSVYIEVLKLSGTKEQDSYAHVGGEGTYNVTVVANPNATAITATLSTT